MEQTETKQLLEELFQCVDAIRAVQVQYLAESNRPPETKLHARQRADTAWKRYLAIYQQFTQSLDQKEKG